MKVLNRIHKRHVGTILTLLIAILFPLIVQHSSYSYLVRILGLTGLYVILALGLNVVVGFLGLLDLGFMAFYAIGAYSMALLSMAGLGFWPALLLGVLITMMVRFLLGTPVLRLRGDYLAIVTLGFGEITRIVLNNWDSLTMGPKGLSLLTDVDVKPVRFFNVEIMGNTGFYYMILFFVVIGLLVSWCLLHSRIGRAWIAVREDETAARLTGIEITKVKMIGFVASAGFAGVAGGIFARWESFVTPMSFTFWESALLVTMVVIGGMGSLPGVIIGVMVVMMVPEILRDILGSGFEKFRYLIFGVALVLVAVYRPQGIWPSQVRHRDLDVEVDEGTAP